MANFISKILLSCVALTGSLLIQAQEVAAQAPGIEALGGAFSYSADEIRTRPVLFAADQVSFDRANNFLSARGNVEIDQAGRTVRADELFYDAANEEMLARGNVLVVDERGNRMTVAEVALNSEFTQGFMRNIQLRLAPDVRVAADYAERRNLDELAIHRAVLTPCPACKDNPERAPLWQVKASQIELDGEAGNVYYKNARFEILGIPVLYAPLFAHADPRVERKTGFLTPTLDVSSERGYGLKVPYYFDITDSTDVTVSMTPYFGRYWTELNSASNTGKNGFGGAAAEIQFRQAIPRGLLTVDGYGLWEVQGSYLDQNNFENDDNSEVHGLAVAQFDWGVTENIRFSSRGHLWSSPEAPLEFGVSTESVINDTARLEGFFGRSYAEIYGESNRVARTSLLATENQYPVFAKANGDFVSEPFWGGAMVRANLDARTVYREQGRDYQRASAEAWFHTPVTLPGGLRIESEFGAVGAIYQVSETDSTDLLYIDPVDPNFTGTAARLQPGASVVASWPLHRSSSRWSQTITPMLGVAYGGPDQSLGEIPNEDSVVVELDQSNLFDAFRTAGIDSVDPGIRVNYGISYDLLDEQASAINLFIGQSYDFVEDEGLITSTRLDGSGLEDQLSHVVAGIDVELGIFSGAWRTRYDIEDNQFYRNDITAELDLGPLNLSGTYGYNQANDGASVSESAKIAGDLTLFSDWKLSAGYTQDLQNEDIRRFDTGIDYTHPCAVFSFDGRRSYDATGEFEDTLSFTVSLPFLGASVGQQVQNQ